MINSFQKDGINGSEMCWITSCSENIKRITVYQSYINTCTSLPSQQVAITVLKEGIIPPKKKLKFEDKFMKLFQDNGFKYQVIVIQCIYFCRKNIQEFIDKLLENE